MKMEDKGKKAKTGSQTVSQGSTQGFWFGEEAAIAGNRLVSWDTAGSGAK